MISPQNLGNDVVELIGYTKLKHLHIVQNKYSPDDILVKPILEKVWKSCRKNNPVLKVHLKLESTKPKTLVWQLGAPVKSIIYDSPQIGVSVYNILT